MKGRIVHRSVLARLNALAKRPRAFFVRVRTRVRPGEHRFHPYLLALIAEQFGHALGAFDQGESLLRLAGGVVGHGQIPQSNELVLRCETLFKAFE